MANEDLASEGDKVEEQIANDRLGFLQCKMNMMTKELKDAYGSWQVRSLDTVK